MSGRRLLVLAAVLLVFLGVAGYLVTRSAAGGGHAVTLTLAVRGTTISPAGPTVSQGDRVTLTVTADRAEEVHLHGYDIHFAVATPGGSVTHTFTADRSGSFPMEIEDTGTSLGQFTVRP